MMILHGHKNHSREENGIDVAEPAKRRVLGQKSGRHHRQDACPNTEDPHQADVVRRFSLNDTHDKRDIKKRQDHARNGPDPLKCFHESPHSLTIAATFCCASARISSGFL